MSPTYRPSSCQSLFNVVHLHTILCVWMGTRIHVRMRVWRLEGHVGCLPPWLSTSFFEIRVFAEPGT